MKNTKIQILRDNKNDILQTYEGRKKVLLNLKKYLIENEEKIIEALKKDLNKSNIESYLSEIQITIKEINLLIKRLKWATKNHNVTGSLQYKSQFLVKNQYFWKFIPLGVIFIISPFNYPFNLAFIPLVGAIAAGNKALIKISDKTPNVAKVTDEIINNTLLKDLCLTLTHNASVEEINTEIDSKPDLIFFTGSSRVGKIIDQKAAKLGIQTIMELGSPCPVFVDKNVNIKLAARRIIWAKMYNSGQTCVSPNHFFVHKDIYDKFLDELKKQLSIQFPNIKSNTQFGQIIDEQQLKNIQAFFKNNLNFEIKTQKNNNLAIIPEFLELDINNEKHQNAINYETFCNIFNIFKVNDYKQALEYTTKFNDDALASYVFSNNKNVMNEYIQKTNSGSLTFNDCLIQVSNLKLPFGGIKESGHGRYRYKASYYAFSYIRSFANTKAKHDFSSRFAPYNEKKWKFIKRFVK
ncbi:aldehyde dehydrogenase family protein [[Mycoplasma] gypis]|uniref:Aldehyde dehydrogenase n=1 Tax=[Mycoplasma] gypis TaxID=92404 RepID=A0ABZ2RPJ1_9BACT|nr:aldehyde dehydrogenase family protein [[Mycoplasma] gypis]MBN0919292.1 aldehyde dehydrogenase family protein [[Mycoplasma] gypis]